MLKRLGKVKQTPSNNYIVVQGHKETYLLKKEMYQESYTDYYICLFKNIKILTELLHIFAHQPLNLVVTKISQNESRMSCPTEVPNIF